MASPFRTSSYYLPSRTEHSDGFDSRAASQTPELYMPGNSGFPDDGELMPNGFHGGVEDDRVYSHRPSSNEFRSVDGNGMQFHSANNEVHNNDRRATATQDCISFAETIGNDLGLSDENKQDLRDFAQVAVTDQVIALVYQQATLMRLVQRSDNHDDRMLKMANDLGDIKASFVRNVAMSSAQKDEITSSAKSIFWKSKRTDFLNESLVADIRKHCEARKQNNGLAPFFDTNATADTKKVLVSALTSQASYVKALLRNQMKEDVYAPGKMRSLTDATRKAMQQFHGSKENITADYALLMLVLRHCAFNRPDLFEPKKAGRPAKRRRTDSTTNGEDGSDISDFFGYVTWWFTQHLEKWGSDRKSSPEWKAFYLSCMEEERRRHPDDELSVLPLVAAPRDSLQARTPATNDRHEHAPGNRHVEGRREHAPLGSMSFVNNAQASRATSSDHSPSYVGTAGQTNQSFPGNGLPALGRSAFAPGPSGIGGRASQQHMHPSSSDADRSGPSSSSRTFHLSNIMG